LPVHPCDPAPAQFNPTLRFLFRLVSKEMSSFCCASVREPKGSLEPQHARLPLPALQLGTAWRAGVAKAVTLVAKAMAAMKETMDLLKNIVKNVV